MSIVSACGSFLNYIPACAMSPISARSLFVGAYAHIELYKMLNAEQNDALTGHLLSTKKIIENEKFKSNCIQIYIWSSGLDIDLSEWLECMQKSGNKCLKFM